MVRIHRSLAAVFAALTAACGSSPDFSINEGPIAPDDDAGAESSAETSPGDTAPPDVRSESIDPSDTAAIDTLSAPDAAPKPPDGTPPCAVMHSNGFGGKYWSCEPIGNWPSLVWDVWASYPGSGTKATTGCPVGGSTSNCVVRYGSPKSGGGFEWIATWCWAGESAGHARLTKPAGIDGDCPTIVDPSWD